MHQRTKKQFITFLAIFFISGYTYCQSVPIPLHHPVNDFILRLNTTNTIQPVHLGMRPFTVDQVVEILDKVSIKDLTIKEQQILNRFKQEFDFKHFEKGVRGPWQKKEISKVANSFLKPYNAKNNEIRLLKYNDDILKLWADWEELFSIEIQDSIFRGFYNDQVTISGSFNKNMSFYSHYSLFRVVHKDSYPLPDEFKQGYVLLEENTNWLVWDVSEASLKYENSILNLEISKTPIYWGFSKQHSPILSANVQSFSFIRLSKDYKQLRARSFIGSLNPYGDDRKGFVEEKNIAAHRFEFDLTPSLTVSFNEMVIYARRNIELGYLLPVNLLWSEEHGLGNRDNILMSFDAYWNAKPGLELYGTFFWDELSWFKLFKSWWGNKFIFQSGFHWVPFTNPQFPDFRIEFTASRPWVYTHNDSLLNYTSAKHGLGFPLGPNSQLIFMEMNMWPSYKSQLSFNMYYIKKGSGEGSNSNDNYTFDDPILDEETKMLMGKVNNSLNIGIRFNYRITATITIEGNSSYDTNDEVFSGRFGLWLNY